MAGPTHSQSGGPQPFASALLYPNTSEAALKQQFIGRQLRDINPPAAVLDAAVVRRNCEAMLETVKRLGVGFRAHVKTHKASQLRARFIIDSV